MENQNTNKKYEPRVMSEAWQNEGSPRSYKLSSYNSTKYSLFNTQMCLRDSCLS